MALGWKRFRESPSPLPPNQNPGGSDKARKQPSLPRPHNRARWWLQSSRPRFPKAPEEAPQPTPVDPMPRWPGGRERALVVGCWQPGPDLSRHVFSSPRSWGACGFFKGRPWDLDRAPPRTRSHQPAGSRGATPLGAGHRSIRGRPWP